MTLKRNQLERCKINRMKIKVKWIKSCGALLLLSLILSCKKEESAPLPIANFYAEVKNCINDTCVVYFYDNSTNNIDWSWDFGNGKQSTQANDSTIYYQLGNYEVTLKVKNIDGVVSSKVKTVQI